MPCLTLPPTSELVGETAARFGVAPVSSETMDEVAPGGRGEARRVFASPRIAEEMGGKRASDA